MGRGSGDVREHANDERTTADAAVAQANADRQAGRKLLLPRATKLADSEGYSDAEKAAQTGNAMEATDAGFDSGQATMENRAGTTGNTAGLAATEGEMNRERARTKSDTARGLQVSFADEKQKRQMSGLQLLANMYGIDTNLVGNISGIPVGAVNAEAGGIGKGGWKIGPVGANYG